MEHILAIAGLVFLVWLIFRLQGRAGPNVLRPHATRQGELGIGPLGLGAIALGSTLLGQVGKKEAKPGVTKAIDKLSPEERAQLDRLAAQFRSELFGFGGGAGIGGLPPVGGAPSAPPIQAPQPIAPLPTGQGLGGFPPQVGGPLPMGIESNPVQLELLRRLMGGQSNGFF